jgi:type IV pilus assembly protein PilW
VSPLAASCAASCADPGRQPGAARGARPPRGSRAANAGLSLVELVVATALSVGVLSAVGYAYANHRLAARHHDALAQIQGSARLALEEIGRELRQAGHVGCNSALQRHVEKRVVEVAVVPPFDPAKLPAGAENFTIDAANALRVFDATSPAAVWGGDRPDGPVAGTRVIEVRYGSADGATRLSGPIAPDGKSIPTMAALEPGRGDEPPQSTNRLALLSDCQGATVVRIDRVETSPPRAVTATTPVDFARCGHASRIGSECVRWDAAVLMPIRVVQFYVAELPAATGGSERRLMSRLRVMAPDGIRWNPPRTVLRGVRDLQVTGVGLDAPAPADLAWRVVRGVDEHADGPAALAALPASEWSRVIRLDLRLSMRAGAGETAGAPVVIRNFEASYTVRARVMQEPT